VPGLNQDKQKVKKVTQKISPKNSVYDIVRLRLKKKKQPMKRTLFRTFTLIETNFMNKL
jgi:hypothetical protein